MSEVTATSLDLSLVLQDKNGKTFRLKISAPVKSMTSLTLQEIVSTAEEASGQATRAPATNNSSNNNTNTGSGEVIELLDSSIDDVSEDEDEDQKPAAEESDEDPKEESIGEESGDEATGDDSDFAEDLPVIKKRAMKKRVPSAPTRRSGRNNKTVAAIVVAAPPSPDTSTGSCESSDAEEAYGMSSEFF